VTLDLNVGRLRRLATGFAGIHSLNAGLSILYSLVQTLVFARVLDHRTFALTILVQAIGMYLMPISQSVARANFVLLREQSVRMVDPRAPRAPEAALAFNINQVLLLVVPILAPLALGLKSIGDYLSLSLFLFAATYSNIWYFEIQMSMMAVDRALEYEKVSFVRRVTTYALLGLLR